MKEKHDKMCPAVTILDQNLDNDEELCECNPYPQPEEWESRFDEDFVYKTKRKDEVVAYEEWLSEYSCEEVKDFIRDEIRKAEERTVKEIHALPARAVSFMHDGIYLHQIEEYAKSKGINFKKKYGNSR